MIGTTLVTHTSSILHLSFQDLVGCGQLPLWTIILRGVHGSGWVGFRPKPNSTRLNRFPEFGIRIRPNIGSDPIYRVIGLSGSESSVSRVWASDWAGLFDRVKITENTFFWAFLLNLFSNRASCLSKLDLLGHQSGQIKRPK